MSDRIVTIDGDDSEIRVDSADGRPFAETPSGARIVLVSIGESDAVIDAGGTRAVVPFVIEGDTISFQYRGEVYRASVADKGSKSRRRHREHSMSAPMPGVVLKLFAVAGATVSKGEPLIVLEAMKMEHAITAPSNGVVKAVNCREGELVQPGVDLIDFEPAKE